ncbi:MAG: DUF4159 domain-containing protein [Proteobacteria bacterium]|nr:DUF4159 domain-containing protein [Pseudomonadota bacterium]
MLTIGSLGVIAPWMLLGLLALPVIWWLLRVTPPSPRRVQFPAIRLLLGLKQTEESSSRTPWWLLALRLLTAALIIIALAEPILNPGSQLRGDGPLLVVIDDDWAAATNWEDRIVSVQDILDQAGRERRPVAILTTAPHADGSKPRISSLMPADEANQLMDGIVPKPWKADHRAALEALIDLPFQLPAEVVWLSNGIGETENTVTQDLAERMSIIGPLTVITDEPSQATVILDPPDGLGAVLNVQVRRATGSTSDSAARFWVRASGDQGQLLHRVPADLASGDVRGIAEFDLPAETRNKIARLDIEGQRSAASLVLLDERWRRRPVGLVSGGAIESQQPLLSDVFFLDRALEPFSEVQRATLGDLLDGRFAVVALADIGQLVAADRPTLENWLEGGGVLVRFAGPKLAEGADDLLPVRLRSGTRLLGGALTWSTPARLGVFPDESPFAGLKPPADLRVLRQVLAEPDLDLSAKTWARLEDGTPLVTAERRGSGWLVLFHVTANTEWSDLPLSGLFVEMLQRLVSLSQGVAGTQGAAALPPLATADGFGRLGQPAAGVLPAGPDVFDEARIGPQHPPGFYGVQESRRALNLSAGLGPYGALDKLPGNPVRGNYATSIELTLLPWLLLAATLLILTDMIASFVLRGQLRFRRVTAGSALLAAALLSGAASEKAVAQASDSAALAATLETHLAYVITGNPQIDSLSASGLRGLSDVLQRRTAIEPGVPIGVDIETDELVFFPLLYWPIDPSQQDLSDQALAKINSFMKTGGTIVFDTRDQQAVELNSSTFSRGPSSDGPGVRRLREVLRKLDMPPLAPVPEDHVLTKAFYLMSDFPGRYSGGAVWVEREIGGANDGVSSIIVGSNDWAAAWAIDDDGRYLASPVPGGNQQREMAYRFGVNLVMYAFTGNYKADQVHIPAILERLGQ